MLCFHRIIFFQEDIERTHCMVLTVRAITGMLTQTILVPSPGNPARGTFDVQPRDKPLGFLHTRSAFLDDTHSA